MNNKKKMAKKIIVGNRTLNIDNELIVLLCTVNRIQLMSYSKGIASIDVEYNLGRSNFTVDVLCSDYKKLMRDIQRKLEKQKLQTKKSLLLHSEVKHAAKRIAGATRAAVRDELFGVDL